MYIAATVLVLCLSFLAQKGIEIIHKNCRKLQISIVVYNCLVFENFFFFVPSRNNLEFFLYPVDIDF